MKERILGYLRTQTSKENCWVTVNELFNQISNDMSESFLFEYNLISLIQDRIVRFSENRDGSVKLALEENITEILNDIKSSAIEEMREELRRCEESEDYEGAIEWRDMINESININDDENDENEDF